MTDLGFVHRFVPATDRSSSVALVLLHGTGGNEQDRFRSGKTCYQAPLCSVREVKCLKTACLDLSAALAKAC
jgi:predicted esterase